MSRSLTTKNFYDKRPGKRVLFADKNFEEYIGKEAELKGCWLVYGHEKNGKTWFTLTLAKALAPYQRINYISAEEGTDGSFLLACRRAGITTAHKILWDDYIPIPDLIEKLKKPKSPQIIVVDNLTIYRDDFKDFDFKTLIGQFPSKLFIFVAHEERKEPYPAVAKLAKKLCKVYIHVVGLKAFIEGRYAKGGMVDIDPEKSELYWGGKADE